MKRSINESERTVIGRELGMMHTDEEILRKSEMDKVLKRQAMLAYIRKSLSERRWCFVDDVSDGTGDPRPYTEEQINLITFRWELSFLRDRAEDPGWNQYLNLILSVTKLPHSAA